MSKLAASLVDLARECRDGGWMPAITIVVRRGTEGRMEVGLLTAGLEDAVAQYLVDAADAILVKGESQ